MKSYVFSLVAVATLFVASDAKAFGLLDRMMGGGNCCAPTCCEATCAAAEPTCCAAPACAAPTCAAEPSCGCAPACNSCCNSCCRPTPVRDFLANLHCRLHSLCHRNRCCDSGCGGCCEATCAAAEPACGCAH